MQAYLAFGGPTCVFFEFVSEKNILKWVTHSSTPNQGSKSMKECMAALKMQTYLASGGPTYYVFFEFVGSEKNILKWVTHSSTPNQGSKA